MILTSTGMIFSSTVYVTPPLDLYGGADTAYSLRKLRTAYAGSSIRVRRSSDNTEQDIGFIGINLDTTSLLSFVGSGNGFVTTFYDQTGNSNNAIQTSATSQPQIISSGSLITQNGKPSMLFDGTNDYLILTSPVGFPRRYSQPVMTTFYVTQNLSPYNYGGIITSKQAGRDDSPALDWDGGTGKMETIWESPYSVLQTTRQNALFIGNALFTGTGGTVEAWTNNVSDGTNSQPALPPISPDNSTWMGTYRTNETVLCGRFYLSEFFNYFSNQSANRVAINSNLNSYYATY